MNYDSFFDEVRANGLYLSFDNPSATETARLSNEALFHLPLLAITVMMLARAKRKPKLDQLGQLVGECFERTFVGFKGSSQHIGWSANLRMRTVRALTFLEIARLVQLDKVSSRIEITTFGREVLEAALKNDSDLTYTLRFVERHYRNIGTERRMALGI